MSTERELMEMTVAINRKKNQIIKLQLQLADMEKEFNAKKKAFDFPKKKECSECKRAVSVHFRCDNEYCENYR